ncbi:MAG: PHP domain-containing protein [Treponema sp.]|nr:PHP domain-containing protein [Treponema sp.]
MIDLHTHSTASDGDLAPGKLVEKAAALGISALALTDHDTLSGLGEAAEAARSRNITLIPGIELEIESESRERPGSENIAGEFHLLGLGLKSPGRVFSETLESLAGARERRNRLMVEKMREAGLQLDYDDIRSLAGGNIVGRPHFGRFLINRKLVKNQEQAFKRYLSRGRPFYVPREGLAFDRAAALIHEAGGIAVLAHPMSLYAAWGRLPALIGSLKERGLDGLEAWHPTAKLNDCKRLEELGLSLGLRITAGSDFHGSARPDRKLGYTAGGRMIDDAVLDAIPELCGASRASGLLWFQ